MRFVNERIVLVTVMCERCGVDSVTPLCSDCEDVLEAEVARGNDSTRVEREQAKEWIEMGIPVKEVATELGRNRVSIQRWIVAGNWQRFRWADAKGSAGRIGKGYV